MKLYYNEASPPCRAVIILANLLRYKLELIPTDPKKGETKTDAYLQMNPQHVIPTLVDDDGTVIWESRVILKHLIAKYSKENKCTLYPSDFYGRLEVDKILDFDLGTVTRRFNDYIESILTTGEKNPSKNPKLDDSMNVLNEILRRNNTTFLNGIKITIADISLAPVISSLEVAGYDLSPYPNIVSWLSYFRRTIPGYETYGIRGELAFKEMIDASLK